MSQFRCVCIGVISGKTDTVLGDAMTLKQKLEQFRYRKATEVSDEFFWSLIDVALAAEEEKYAPHNDLTQIALERLEKVLQ